MKSILLLVAACICALVAGCNSSTHQAQSLTGIYGVSNPKTGQVDPFVKIEAASDAKDGYLLYEYNKGAWTRPKTAWSDAPQYEQVRPFQKADLEKLVHHSVDAEVSGVQVHSFAVVQVPPGWSDKSGSRPFSTSSGYFALTLLGPIDLVRM